MGSHILVPSPDSRNQSTSPAPWDPSRESPEDTLWERQAGRCERPGTYLQDCVRVSLAPHSSLGKWASREHCVQLLLK